jgi:hypothetical protein
VSAAPKKRMQLAGASALEETSNCVHPEKSPKLMRGPLGCCTNAGNPTVIPWSEQ